MAGRSKPIYTDVEREVILLATVMNLIDDIVNHQIFCRPALGRPTSLLPQNEVSRRLACLLFVDFLAGPNRKAFGFTSPPKTHDPKQDQTFLWDIQEFCDSASFEGPAKSLRSVAEQFSQWLFGEVTIPNVWLSEIELETDLAISRKELFYIAGNICKHNPTRLHGVVTKILRNLEKNGHQLTLEGPYQALEDYKTWFYDHAFAALLSKIAEHLIELRTAVCEYLRPEFWRSKEDYYNEYLNSMAWRYHPPVEIVSPFAKGCYWELMEKLRKPPIFPRFSAIEPDRL